MGRSGGGGTGDPEREDRPGGNQDLDSEAHADRKSVVVEPMPGKHLILRTLFPDILQIGQHPTQSPRQGGGITRGERGRQDAEHAARVNQEGGRVPGVLVRKAVQQRVGGCPGQERPRGVPDDPPDDRA